MTLPPTLSWWPLLPADGMVAVRDLPGDLKNKRITLFSGHLKTQTLASYVALVLGSPSIEEIRVLTQEGFKWLYWYGIIPSKKHPRWFVPLIRCKMATEGLCMYSPQRWYTRLAKKMLNAGVSMRLPWPGPRLLIALRRQSPLVKACARWTGIHDLYLSFSSGTPGPFRKITVQAVGTNGHDRAYIKIAAAKRAEQRINNEARILATLNADQKYCRFTPELLFSGEWNGFYLLAQSVLRGRSGPIAMNPLLWSFLTSLIGDEHVPAYMLSFWNTIKRRILSNSHLIPFWNQIKVSLKGRLIPKTIMHGDFVPWNVRVTQSGLAVLDWESAELEGIPLFDVYHYVLQYGFLVKRWSAEKAVKELRCLLLSVPFIRYMEHASLNLQDATALLRCYLLFTLTEGDAGETPSLQAKRIALLKVLESRFSLIQKATIGL